MRFPLFLIVLFAPFVAGASPFSLPRDLGECTAHEQQYTCGNERDMEASIRAYCDRKVKQVIPPPSLTPEDARKLRDLQLKDCVSSRLTAGTASCNECERLRAVAAQPAPAQPERGPGQQQHAGEAKPPKEKPDEPGGSKTDTADCNSESCLRRAAQEQREAEALARQRRADMERSAREAQRNKNSSITTAADFLDQWGQSLAQNPKATPQEQAHYQSDRRLFERAISGQPFTEADAKAAHSPFVRDSLELYGQNGAQEAEYQREGEKAAKGETELRQLAQRTEARAGTLGRAQGSRAPAAVYPVSGQPAAGRGSAVAPSGQSTIAVANKGSSPESARGKGVDAPAPKGDTAAGPESDLGKGPGGFAPGGKAGPGLRDLLKRRLGEKGGPARGAPAEKATRDPDRRGNGLWAGGDEPVAGFAAEVLAEAERKAPDYAIGAEETSRQLRAMMSEAGFEEGQGSAGLLGVDTATLFERVRQAHRSCQARDCVR